jgi:hypothetical protein
LTAPVNLLGEFQRACGLASYRQPATLRALVFLCGALLGRAGHRLVLHLSASWGGLQQRILVLENILTYEIPTSPKLHPKPATCTQIRSRNPDEAVFNFRIQAKSRGDFRSRIPELFIRT